ncbi:hypothetical protein QEN19_003620 [Hanseniaspora menglaensis]
MNSQIISQYISKNQITAVTLVIAHPDDEIMFFNQLLLALNHWHSEESEGAERILKLNIICLTDGDNNKKYGKLRESELEDSCKTLLSNFSLSVNLFIHVGNFIDSMTEEWDITDVTKYLSEKISSAETNLVITFDSAGISGHINHRTCNVAVLKLFNHSNSTHIWSLQTPKFFCKYIGGLACILSSRRSNSNSIVLTNNDIYQLIYLIGIMGFKHKSQMVWYRWLWWLFNSLTWSTTFDIVKYPKKQI